MATIQEVAACAGVSVGTVSRYLNGHKLKPANEKKVKDAVKKLNYHENYLAKSLRSNQTMTIGLLINNMQNHFATDVVSRLEIELELNDYSIILSGFSNNKDLYERKLKTLFDRKIDGLILFEGRQEWPGKEMLKDLSIPAIAISSPYDMEHIDSITADDLLATQKVISKMIELGHEKIGIIAAPQREYSAKERLSGAKLAFKLSGLPEENLVIKYGDYSRESGYHAMLELLEEDKCECIFVCNFNMSRGALQAVYEKNLRIGENLSFACFDYQETLPLFYPHITTICPDTGSIGGIAAQQLLNAINTKTLCKNKTICVPNKIIWNKSIVDLR